MGKAQECLTEKGAGGRAVDFKEVKKELAHGDWGRIATQKFDDLTSYWFDDGSRLITGKFGDDSDEFIIRADLAFSEEDFQNMTPDEAEGHRAIIDSLKK